MSQQPGAPAPRRYKRSQCPACRAPIMWAFDQRKQRIALDVDPVTPGAPAAPGKTTASPADVLLIDTPEPYYPRARVVADQTHLFGATRVYYRHVTRCANPEQLRAICERRAQRQGAPVMIRDATREGCTG